jgi:hypothetical protein
MHYKPNALSALGRMGYSTHLLFYPTALSILLFGVLPWWNKKQIADEEKEWATIPPAGKVDPDLFNPFTPIPYHNNPQLKYVFAHINMHGHLDPKTHMNPNTYAWKNYHNSYDHNNQAQYMYNWISMHGPRD